MLVFCPTKAWCEKLAETVSKDFFSLGKPNPKDKDPARNEIRQKLQAQLNGSKLAEVIEQLKRSPAGLDQSLGKSISFGAAYHHAGKL